MSTERKDDMQCNGTASMREPSGELNSKEQDAAEDASEPDCPVCLQPCIHPVRLPCSHIFCFLCVKGVASRSKRCALCRQDIPSDFFCHPNLVRKADLNQTKVFDDEFQWYYEGQNGWWQYDDRTSLDMENHFKKGVKNFELLIAGYVYLIDLDKMVQCQRNDRTKKRRVKRDLACMPGKKGIAGLKFVSRESSGSGVRQTECESDRPGADGDEVSTPTTTHQIMVPIPIHPMDRTGGYTNSLSPPTPYNTPQTPQTPAESPPNPVMPSEQDLTIQLERLRLGEHQGVLSTSPQDGTNGGSGPFDGPQGARPTEGPLGLAGDSPEVFTRVRPRGISETCPDDTDDEPTSDPEEESEIYSEIEEAISQEVDYDKQNPGHYRDGDGV